MPLQISFNFLLIVGFLTVLYKLSARVVAGNNWPLEALIGCNLSILLHMVLTSILFTFVLIVLFAYFCLLFYRFFMICKLVCLLALFGFIRCFIIVVCIFCLHLFLYYLLLYFCLLYHYLDSSYS